MNATLAPSVRISVGGGAGTATATDKPIAVAVTAAASAASEERVAPAQRRERARLRREPDTDQKEKETAVVNPMSVSVPNLSAENAAMEPTAAAGLLETFAAIARRRTFGEHTWIGLLIS